MDHDEVHNVTLLPHEMFTSEELADLDTAVVVAGGDEMDDEEDGEVYDYEDGCDLILELEAADRADTEEMTKLRELEKDGSSGYLVDNRGLLRIADKVYIPETLSTHAALLIRHIHEKPSIGHPGCNCMVSLLSIRFQLTMWPREWQST